jgi:hypothetical protein
VQRLEGAASRGGEQIDDGLDRVVGMMVGVEPAVGAVLGLGLMMKAAVGEGSAQPFMKEEKEQGDLNPFRREVIGAGQNRICILGTRPKTRNWLLDDRSCPHGGK